MSTHAAIAIKLDENKYKAIYCHFDGYLSGTGKKLKEHYADIEKVKKLIDLGDISWLGKEVDIPEGVQHSFEKPANEITIAYGRDRGEKNTSPDTYVSAYDIKLNIDCNRNLYIFENGKWTYNEKEY
jgi:hypothetical protein